MIETKKKEIIIKIPQAGHKEKDGMNEIVRREHQRESCERARHWFQ
jgi:hypothetical protein